MNTKTLKLGITFIVLVGLAFAYKPLTELKNNFGKPSNFLSGIEFADITKIEISKAGERVVLENLGDKWKIADTKEFFADANMVANFKTKFEEAEKAGIEVISENPDKKADFNVNEELGSHVLLWSGEKLLSEFILGKPGNDFVSSYVALADEDKTYSLKTNLSGSLGNTDWYDKTIFQDDKELITKLRFQYQDSEFTLEKIENEWTGVLPYKFSVDEEKLTSILNAVSNLKAVKIPTQTFTGTGLEKNSIIIEATGEGFNNTLMLGEANENDEYFAKRGDSDNIYLVDLGTKEDLDVRIKDLR